MSDAQKKPFEDKAAKAKAEYQKAMEEWKSNGGGGGEDKECRRGGGRRGGAVSVCLELSAHSRSRSSRGRQRSFAAAWFVVFGVIVFPSSALSCGYCSDGCSAESESNIWGHSPW
mmetsp:Transcript_109367/g.353107  ORF Transcript_109367/g.353107 Transcript_109367/m.353107 type:complete len:115 (-) Transcript_109367:558-902(-)